MATKPNFILKPVEEIRTELIALYESDEISGRTLFPAQVETLIINMAAYRESLLRKQVNDAALQNLVEFSTAPIIDYLGMLVGTYRLPAAPAKALFAFEFEISHPPLIIPAGFAVATENGLLFALQDDLIVGEDVTTVGDIELVCTTDGIAGNGFQSGKVATITAPQPYLLDCQNSTITEGGVEVETDDQLRTRIKLAPDAFSTAGSRGGYKYWTRTASQSIIDVSVIRSPMGEVLIYPLLTGGGIPDAALIDDVEAILSDDKVRPVSDTPIVNAPTQVDFTVSVNVTRRSGVDATNLQAAVVAALQALVNERKNTLGADCLLTQIGGAVQGVEGVYTHTIVSPVADVVATDTEVAFCTAVTVNITATV